MLNVIFNDNKYEVESGTLVSELLKDEIKKSKYPVIACKFNNEVKILDYDLKKNGKIELIDLSDRDGMRIYVRGLIAIVIKAFEKLFKKSMLTVNYTLGDALYCNVEGEPIDEEAVEKLKEEVSNIINQNIPFERLKIPIEEAMELDIDNITKERLTLSKNRFDSYITLYKFENSYYYLYGVMPTSTSDIKLYDIRKYEDGILIRYPKKSSPNILDEYKDTKKLFNTFEEYEDIHRTLGVFSVSTLNKMIKNDEGDELIRIDEALHEKKISQIADKIAKDKNIKVILIAGPSSSGKTTFAKRLSTQLKINGIKPITLSVDNYFVERTQTPKDDTGNFDFESIEAVDLKLFNQQITDLLEGKEVDLPTFNFKMGTKEYLGNKLKLKPDNVLVIEGIHCLNEILTSSIPKKNKFKIYVSALTVINLDDYNRISTTDTRIIRRIVRDNKYRSHKASDTLKMWYSVSRGEEKNIFPYQEEADAMFNSSLIYELAVLKSLILPLLSDVESNTPEYSEARRLYELLSYFNTLDFEHVPETSLLREFIGGSCYKY